MPEWNAVINIHDRGLKDALIVLETVGSWAGLSFWTREDLRRYPFIRTD